jgi:hypothetical protein
MEFVILALFTGLQRFLDVQDFSDWGIFPRLDVDRSDFFMGRL